jgi:GT2 family glycosyltransferase
MASFMSSSPEVTPSPSVVAAIIAADAAVLSDTLEAVRSQVYEPASIVIVGKDTSARQFATAETLDWVSRSDAVVDDADPAVTHIWFLFSGAVPRPDALGALLRTADRVDAGVTGSKILDRDDPSNLLSVGMATDVFDVPYTGLAEDEKDQGQHDVVRDVAALAPVSILVRRDLARGVGGIDRAVGPMSAATDLCQRVRLRGGRIVVAPGSEVMFPKEMWKAVGWREQAGQIRAMFKVYGPLTLVWLLPLSFLVGFVAAVLALFIGRWRLFAWVRAWVWNLIHLPGSIADRRRARAGRAGGDSELFVYQVKGSVALRSVGSRIAANIRARLPGDERLSIGNIGHEMRQPSFITGAAVVVFVLLATRSIWSNGVPAVGYSLPFPSSGTAALGAYAGGWNPAGLGSVEPLQPLFAIVGTVQTVLFDDRRLAEFALVAGAYILGIWGVVRLLRTWAIGAVPGALAGIAYVAGAASQGVAANTDLGTLFALGVFPWVIRVAVSRWPETLLSRVGRVAGVVALTAVLAALSPLLIVAPTAVLLIWALMHPRDVAAWRVVGLSAVGAILAVPLMMPWVAAADLGPLLSGGDAYWTTSVLVVAGVIVAALGTIVAAPERLGAVAGWGALLAAGGALVARANGLGAGVEVESAALAVVALGMAAVVGASFETIVRIKEVTGWRRVVAGAAVVGAVIVILSTPVVLVGGRAGLPGDRFRAAFDFTEARPGDPTESRILVVGAPGSLPGDERIIDRAAYRVVSAPMPDLWEALLSDPLAGDEALAAELESLITGETSRVGEKLAPFGIRWVVVLSLDEGDEYAAAWVRTLEGQLDLIPLGAGLAYPTFENEAESTVRALTGRGRAWPHIGTGYEGLLETGGRVTVGENANDRWGPGPWNQVGWASEVSTDQGYVRFDAIGNRRIQAVLAGVAFLVLLGFAWAGRKSE